MPIGEVLTGCHELALVLRTGLDVQATPSRVELEECVLDEVALGHKNPCWRANAEYMASASACSSRFERRLLRRYRDRYSSSRADCSGFAVLLDLPGRRYAPHR